MGITRSEAIKTLKEHLSHWERLLQEHICEKQEGIDTISALKLAIASLETDEAYQLEYERTTKNDLGHCQHTDKEIAKSFIEDVEAVKDLLPSVTPQEPRKGHWITTRTFMHDGEFYCDKCKCDAPNNEKWDYCPNCGADMREVEE